MKRLWTTVSLILLLLIFLVYMVFDMVFSKENVADIKPEALDSEITDQWVVERIFDSGKGKLESVAVSNDDKILLGGDSFIACYDSNLNLLWESNLDSEVTAVAFSSDKVYAASVSYIIVLNHDGERLVDWGPWDEKAFITSISANDNFVAFADAAGKSIIILDTEGELKQLLGKSGEPFYIPSPYFDIALGKDDTLYVANTGKLRIERRKTDGTLIDFFGTPGLAPDAFCGCCNPANFALLKDGFVTTEKGVNRIKILDKKGDFKELVSSVNKFLPPIPLDVAVSSDGNIIFGANPADSKLYIFKRK